MAGEPSRDLAGDVNPYASPQVPDAVDRFAGLGVGVWRDGRYLVMHREAELPRYCLHTGEPAAGYYVEEMDWKERGAMLSWRAKLQVPACRKCLSDERRLRARRLLSLAMMGISLIPLLFVARLGESAFLAVFAAIGLGLCGVGVWLGAYWAFGKPLSVAHGEGKYLWLKNVHRDVLRRLPEWPLGD